MINSLNKKYSFLLTLIVGLYFMESCKSQSKYTNSLGSFDVFGDSLIYSCYQANKSDIYLINLLDGKKTVVASSEDNAAYLSPKFSHDGKKLLFIETNKDRSQLLYSVIKDATVEVLLDTNGIITEATFSNDARNIYFLKADVFKNYSPIASKGYHDFRVFSINVESKMLVVFLIAQLMV